MQSQKRKTSSYTTNNYQNQQKSNISQNIQANVSKFQNSYLFDLFAFFSWSWAIKTWITYVGWIYRLWRVCRMWKILRSKLVLAISEIKFKKFVRNFSQEKYWKLFRINSKSTPSSPSLNVLRMLGWLGSEQMECNMMI